MWYLQVQAGMDRKKTVLQVGMEDEELHMEGYSGQFGCRKEEGSRLEMEEPEWTDGTDASDELEPMEDFYKSCCVLGTVVEGPHRA